MIKSKNMGQIAEDILDGTCCEICGCYFGKLEDEYAHTHGYPVICWDCWRDMTKEERKGHQRAKVETLTIMMYDKPSIAVTTSSEGDTASL